jgi:hypothetical protein
MAVAAAPGSYDPGDGVLEPCRGGLIRADVRRLKGEVECTLQIYACVYLYIIIYMNKCMNSRER